jgi:hypothetical protein
MNEIVKQLPAHLFWDSDISKLDDIEHYEKIIRRTFERGDLEDKASVMAYYGKEICADVLKSAFYLEESAQLYGSLFFPLTKKILNHMVKNNTILYDETPIYFYWGHPSNSFKKRNN